MPFFDIAALLSNKTVRLAAAAVVGAVVLKQALGLIRSARRSAATRKRLAAGEKNVVYLYQMPRFKGMIGMSAPCVRVETFLRVHNIPYEVVFVQDATMSPTERFPFIELNGVAIAESQFIIEHVAKHFNIDIAQPTADAAATEVALRRMCEDSLRLSYYRFLMVDSYKTVVPVYAKALGAPAFALPLVFFFFKRTIRRRIIDMLNNHGHGDLTDEQFQAEWLRDVKAIEAHLLRNSGSKYFIGNGPSTADCAVFPWLYNMLYIKKFGLTSPALEFVSNSAALNAFVSNIVATLYPDAEKISSEPMVTAPRQRFVK